jgi:serine/threonine-protein kinase
LVLSQEGAVSTLLTCPQGHQWTGDDPACPVCGAGPQVRSRLDRSESSKEEIPSFPPTMAPPGVADARTVTMAAPAAAESVATPGMPAVPGYAILGVLGRGGMGVVYQARQLRPNRLVALKMVLAGAHAGPQQRARLYLEAEALAGLQHPNIVQVYEVGEHDRCPYLALEFVDGGSLDSKLARQPQPPRQTAEMVETLARAMHAAHQRGIIHRDLKPANVLLSFSGRTESGVGPAPLSERPLNECTPKITDFGLAKRLESQGQTQTGQVMGTPNYMAPEQAAGMTHEIGPLADVWALGAILYEMLTGKPPFAAASAYQTIELVLTQEPVAPGRLGRKVPRDLETICLKCLQKDAKKRYASAHDLAEDLRRFRAGEPIQARPVSRAERAVKWVKRRPLLAAMYALIAVTALGLAGGVVWHNVRLRAERDWAEANFQRAERNFDRARRAVEAMLTEVGNKELADEPRMEEKRKALLEKALGFYQEFLDERSDDPGLLEATALAHKQVADIYRLLQDGRAEQAYNQAIALLAPLVAEFPDRLKIQQELADGHNWRGEVLRLMDRPREAQEAYEAALRIQWELITRDPGNQGYRKDQARTFYNLGILSKDSGKMQEAKDQFAAAVKILEDLAKQNPEKPEYRQHLARAYLNRGPALRVTDGFDRARASYNQAITLLKELRKQDPAMPDYRHELGVTYNNLGWLLRLEKKHGEADKAHRGALGIFETLNKDFPSVPVYRKELATTYDLLGILFTDEHDWSGAEAYFGQARDMFEALVHEFPKMVDYQVHLGMSLGNLGWERSEHQDWKGALPEFARSVATLEKARAGNPVNRRCRQALCTRYQSLSETRLQVKQHAGAAEAALAVPQVFGRVQDFYNAACFLARCIPLAQGDTWLGTPEQRKAVADGYADKAVAMLREVVRGDCSVLQRLPQETEYFRPLDGRADFQSLRAELEARSKPVARKAGS